MSRFKCSRLTKQLTQPMRFNILILDNYVIYQPHHYHHVCKLMYMCSHRHTLYVPLRTSHCHNQHCDHLPFIY